MADEKDKKEMVHFGSPEHLAMKKELDRKLKTSRLFPKSELAKIQHTPQNIAQAVAIVNVATDQTRTMLEMSQQQRGMYLCWLKVSCTEHGEWMKFCNANFPDIDQRNINRWMLAYQIAIGEKKPLRALPNQDELSDAEYAESIESMEADKKDLAPRSALLAENKKLRANQDKGVQQRQADQQAIEELKNQIEQMKADAFIPKDVKDEDAKCLHIKNAFWRFVTLWNSNLPDDEARLKSHFGLCRELEASMSTLWEEHLGPAFEQKQAKAKKKP
jgi:hypothetical protein